MKRKRISSFAFVVILGTAGLLIAGPAETSPWTLSLGLNYRGFDGIELDEHLFNNPSYAGSGYVNGELLGPNTLQVESTLQTVAGPPPTASVDRISGSGGDFDLDEELGFSFGARKAWRTENQLRFSWDVTLNTAHPEFSQQLNGMVVSDLYTGNALDVTGTVLSDPGGLTVTAGGGTAITRGQLDYDAELDLYTLGLGVAAERRVSALDLYATAGGTANLADFEMDITERTYWTAGPNTGDLVYPAQRYSDETTRLLFGAYVGLGASMGITDNIGVQLEWRYDYVFRDLDASAADMDLDGMSGVARLVYSF